MNHFKLISLIVCVIFGQSISQAKAESTLKKLDLRPTHALEKKSASAGRANAKARASAKARAPASDGERMGAEPINPLLERTDLPPEMRKQRSGEVSCEASTAYYGKACTSRFLSF